MQNCAQLIPPFRVWVLHSHFCPIMELRQHLPCHFTWLPLLLLLFASAQVDRSSALFVQFYCTPHYPQQGATGQMGFQ